MWQYSVPAVDPFLKASDGPISMCRRFGVSKPAQKKSKGAVVDLYGMQSVCKTKSKFLLCRPVCVVASPVSRCRGKVEQEYLVLVSVGGQ